MRYLLSALFTALLFGCAASPRQLGSEALTRGDLRTAEQQLTIAARQGSGATWNDLGNLYHRQGKIQQAIDAFNMGARYGDPTARANLARNKLPIPPADLVRAPSNTSSTDGIAAGIDGFNRGYNSGVTCTTFGDASFSRTTCR